MKQASAWLIGTVSAFSLLSACSHENVQETKVGDYGLSCGQLTQEIVDVALVQKDIEDATGFSGRNVGMALLFWPGIFLNEMNADDAKEAADKRMDNLVVLFGTKKCDEGGLAKKIEEKLKENEEDDDSVASTSTAAPDQKIEESLVDSGNSVRTIIGELAEQLATDIKENKINRIAILPLYDSHHEIDTPLGHYLTDKLTNTLYKTRSTTIVERSQLNEVIKEVQMTKSGRFEDTSVQAIGKLLGVDAVIIGSYAVLGTHWVELNTRIIGVETGEIVGVGSVNIPSTAVASLL